MAEAQQPLDVEELLKELAIKIERVKVLYEQYFMGIEKLEPLTTRKEVQRAMLLLQQQHIRNTGLRFKFNTMLQKWNIYVTYWNRITREIENGTYVRHLAKAARSAEREGKALPAELARHTRGRAGGKTPLDFDKDTSPDALPRLREVDTSDLELVPAPPPRPKVPGMSDAELRTLYKKLTDLRKTTGEAAVSYEALVNSLAKQAPRVLEQPGVKSVRFDVTVRGGKAVLKAIPQK